MPADNNFIFLISDTGQLTKAPGMPYGSEDLRQKLLATHSEVADR